MHEKSSNNNIQKTHIHNKNKGNETKDNNKAQTMNKINPNKIENKVISITV